MINRKVLGIFILFLLTPSLALAAAQTVHEPVDLTDSAIGFTALILFVLAYLLVMGEEFLHLRKLKPVLITAGIIWGMIG